MVSAVNPNLTAADVVVLADLLQDITDSTDDSGARPTSTSTADQVGVQPTERAISAISQLQAQNDPTSSSFTASPFTTWNTEDIPDLLASYVVDPYVNSARRIVRHPQDVVFLSHVILYLCINLPSALCLLFYRFSYTHGIAHLLFTVWCIGPFTLMLHNHIHNNGVLAKDWKIVDTTLPYLLEPLFGHTWDSYYWHHIKHHHVEGNGPNDLSSTLRYQRDELSDFLRYSGRFFFLIWAELPLYFIGKGQTSRAARVFASEMASYAFMYTMMRFNSRASTFVFLLPFAILRLGLMIGNWGQHALVDEVDPTSDFRTSITLIDVPSNRFCFNDGYHTAHHLNPRRHWREHPIHFLQSKEAYRSGKALVFTDIDYLMMTICLMRKNYAYLADRLVPMGDQIGMSKTEIQDMLRTKTRKFTEDDIRKKFK